MTHHILTNAEIELDGDRATVRAMFTNPMHLRRMAELRSLRRLGTGEVRTTHAPLPLASATAPSATSASTSPCS